jgi:hypothetical protein
MKTRAVHAWRVDNGEVVARPSQGCESLLKGGRLDSLELRSLFGLPGVRQSERVPCRSSSSMKSRRPCWKAATAIEAAVVLSPRSPFA